MIKKGEELSGGGPCESVQVDLSCLMDGELDDGAARRVLVHLEVCPRCRRFFGALRRQVRAHQDAFRMMAGGPAGGLAGRGGSGEVELDRRRLAQAFYELGKAYVLVSISPSFRREVASEPLPIPSCRSKGRALLDGYLGGRRFQDRRAQRWNEVRNLLKGRLGDKRESLRKGIRILEESLELQADFFQARIYLGHARNLVGDLEGACEEFRHVLREAREERIRGFALENLGNTYLQMDELEDAARCFRRVVHGDILRREPRFFTSWFNLGLTYGLQGKINQSMGCFRELHDNYSKQRQTVREIFSTHREISSLLDQNDTFRNRLREKCPGFFAAR